MKPFLHARSSVRKFGGQPSDYIAIHEKMDSSKSAHATMKHRLVFHSAFGVYLIADIFGSSLVNSDNHEVSVRDIAELHVIEDLGKIPSLDDWLEGLPLQSWMGNPIKHSRTFNIFENVD